MLTRACWLSIGCLLWIAPTVAFARPQVNSAPPTSQAQTHSHPSVTPSTPDEEQEQLEEIEELEQMEEIEVLEEEVGDRDPTYLRTRLVFRYDYRLFVADATANRLRLRVLYGFGPKQRYAVSFLEPLVETHTPLGTARGSGDASRNHSIAAAVRPRHSGPVRLDCRRRQLGRRSQARWARSNTR